MQLASMAEGEHSALSASDALSRVHMKCIEYMSTTVRYIYDLEKQFVEDYVKALPRIKSALSKRFRGASVASRDANEKNRTAMLLREDIMAQEEARRELFANQRRKRSKHCSKQWEKLRAKLEQVGSPWEKRRNGVDFYKIASKEEPNFRMRKKIKVAEEGIDHVKSTHRFGNMLAKKEKEKFESQRREQRRQREVQMKREHEWRRQHMGVGATKIQQSITQSRITTHSRTQSHTVAHSRTTHL